MIIPNETEAATLAGLAKDDPGLLPRSASLLMARGCGACILTRGDSGCVIVSREDPKSPCHVHITRLPALRVEAVDTVAAGDAFVGALAAHLGWIENAASDFGASMCASAHFATHAAALSVIKLGAQPSLPRYAEIERLIKDRRQEWEAAMRQAREEQT